MEVSENMSYYLAMLATQDGKMVKLPEWTHPAFLFISPYLIVADQEGEMSYIHYDSVSNRNDWIIIEGRWNEGQQKAFEQIFQQNLDMLFILCRDKGRPFDRVTALYTIKEVYHEMLSHEGQL